MTVVYPCYPHTVPGAVALVLHQTSSDIHLLFGTTSQSVILLLKSTIEAQCLAQLEALLPTTASIQSGQITTMTLFLVDLNSQFGVQDPLIVLYFCIGSISRNCTHAHTCRTHTCTHICTYICKHMHFHMQAHAQLHMHTHAYIHTCVCAHMHTHTDPHAPFHSHLCNIFNTNLSFASLVYHV